MNRTRSVGRENFFVETVERDACLLLQSLLRSSRWRNYNGSFHLPQLPLFIVKCDWIKLLSRYVVAPWVYRVNPYPNTHIIEYTLDFKESVCSDISLISLSLISNWGRNYLSLLMNWNYIEHVPRDVNPTIFIYKFFAYL